MATDLPIELWDRIKRVEELAEEISVQIHSIREVQEHAKSKDKQRPTNHFLRIAQFLLSKKNRPRSAWAILKATGITRSSLSQILHRTHKDSFVASPIPGYARKKMWSLTDKGVSDASQLLRNLEHVQKDLFGTEEGELTGLKAVDCCARILKDHDNEPMDALAMAQEAIQRGYRGFRVKGSETEVLLTTAKSFWAALGRDRRFHEVRPLVFVLRTEPLGTTGVLGEPEKKIFGALLQAPGHALTGSELAAKTGLAISQLPIVVHVARRWLKSGGFDVNDLVFRVIIDNGEQQTVYELRGEALEIAKVPGSLMVP